MIAFAYIRVSGAAQVDGDGPDRQREKIIDFCHKHCLLPQGVNKPEEYFEAGVSGTVEAMDRPAFTEALQHIERNPGDYCMIVERMDRLARTLMVQEVLLHECRKRGIKVFSADRGELVDQASDGADPVVKFMRQILGAVAEFEKNVLVTKMKAAKDRKRKENGHCEGPKPYGATPAEQDVIKFICKGVEDSRPFRHIAGSLNLSGYRTRTGKEWNKARVSHVFQSLV
jgi:DNA invertase Pin-like site-specific DNA recombinase